MDTISVFEKKIILYGAGYCGAMFAELLDEKEISAECFFDSDPKKEGKHIMDKVVQLPARMPGPDAYLIIVCILKKGEVYLDIRRQMQELGYRHICHIYDLKKERELFLHQNLIISPDREFIEANRKEYEWLENVLADQESKDTLHAILRFMMGEEEFSMHPHPIREQYFAYDLYQKVSDETVIDCGAFKGEVMEIFLQKNHNLFRQYIAVEPDEAYVAELNRKRAKMNPECAKHIKIFPIALSNCREEVRYTNYANEDSVIKGNGKCPVQAISLDELLDNVECSMLKIDVEGYEQKVIEGAEKLIQKNLPVIAVAAYHKEEDFYMLCRKIQALSREYTFYLRSYMNLQETILYAVPQGRKVK